jgi:enoyl-CoA hydratase/carnithine racemase
MTVNVRSEGPVQIVVINRPHVRNAIDSATAQALDQAIKQAEADATVGAIVLTATGNRAFCSGLDLREASGEGPATAVPKVIFDGGFCGLTERVTDKLIIAAVNGAAVGGGWELALACDLIVAAETAFFASNEVSRGMIADGGASVRLPRIIGPYLARELLLTGDPLSAFRAAGLGLVNKVVPGDQLLSTAVELAQRILRHAPQAIGATRKLVNEAGGLPDPSAWAVNASYASQTVPTSDAWEGSTAYVEKREARWTGH